MVYLRYCIQRTALSLCFGLMLCLAQTAVAEQSLATSPAIELPEGFELQVFAADLTDAKGMALAPDGSVFVGSSKAGQIYYLHDVDQDGFSETRKVVANDLILPTGVAFAGGHLYVLEVSRLIRFPDILARIENNQSVDYEVLYDWFPHALYHGWKQLKIGPDGLLYFSIGAPCDRCLSADDRMATLARIDPEGDDFEIVASGVRFSSGFDWHPKTQMLYFTDTAPEHLASQHSLSELNVLNITGLHFGFPFCHGGLLVDPAFRNREECGRYENPVWRFPQQSYPQGVLFYRGKAFPEHYRGRLFVALQGEWNKPSPLGFQIVTVQAGLGQPVEQESFARGWLGERGQIRGQPTDLLELGDGSLLVSDEYRGIVYRIFYRGTRAVSEPAREISEETAGMCYP